jgi:hypothetical protein
MTRRVVAAVILAAACSREAQSPPRSDSAVASPPQVADSTRPGAGQDQLHFVGSPSSIAGVEYLGSTGYTVDSVLYANFWVSTGGTQQVWLGRATGSADNETTPWTVIASLTPSGLAGDARIWQAGCAKDGVADPRLVVALHWDEHRPIEGRVIQAWLADPGARQFTDVSIDGISCRNTAPDASPPRQYAATPSVSVRVASYSSHVDTIELGYVIQNAASASRPVAGFALVTAARIARMRADSDGHDWLTSATRGAAPAPRWATRGATLDVGQTSGRLTIVGVGVADVIEYLAIPDSTQPIDTSTSGGSRDRVGRGRTIGVVPRPAGLTAEGQAKRIDDLIGYACGGATLISDRETCTTLRSKVAIATASLSNPDQARRDIGSFISALDANAGEGAGKTIPMSAYALLRPNASLLLTLSRPH